MTSEGADGKGAAGPSTGADDVSSGAPMSDAASIFSSLAQSDYAPILIAFGVVLVSLRAISFYKEWSHAKALTQAAREAAELEANPRCFTAVELHQYNGCDLAKPLLLSIKGRVLNVNSGKEYYGQGGAYKIMAGKDASKAFAMMSLKEEDAHNDLTGVDDDHLQILDDWYDKLSKKYPTVGELQGGCKGLERHGA